MPNRSALEKKKKINMQVKLSGKIDLRRNGDINYVYSTQKQFMVPKALNSSNGGEGGEHQTVYGSWSIKQCESY